MKINFHNKAVWKILSIAMLMSVFFTFNQCVVQQYDSTVVKTNSDIADDVDPYHSDPVMNSGTLPSGGSGEFEETGATEVARLVTDIGVKDYESLYVTFQVLTGVDVSNESTLRNVYEDIRSQLPFDSSIKNFGTANQIAIIKIASEFCHTVFNKSTYYNTFFNNFNIAQSSINAFSNNGKALMIEDMINRFWGSNVQPFEVEQNAKTELNILIDDLLVGTSNSTTTTRTIAKGVCTSLLASAPVTML
jgi:hypothetical protein